MNDLSQKTHNNSISETDLYLFNKGVHYKIYQTLGAQFVESEGVKGVRFAVWAPNAKEVFLIGDFNHWDNYSLPMHLMGGSGIWELFIPELREGSIYKFLIKTQDHRELHKADPYAFCSERRPYNASVVVKRDQLSWTDDYWMKNRGNLNAPMNIYEVHLGSWKNVHSNEEKRFPNYRDLARELADYCKDMGYTHIELLPVMEHPLDESWGYQVTGFYSITSRYGSLLDFQWFVNYLHQQNIGIILDWVPAHFPKDEFSLGRFDGTALYEHEDPRQGLHPHWNTLIFNYGRTEVSNFLIGSALYLLDELHIDGLRVDAVASLLYLDYGRHDGNWIPNVHGGNENLEAIEFLKHFNSIIQTRFPSVFVVAEESSIFPRMTLPVEQGGLGFTMKWNMGWMSDTLRFLERSFEDRSRTFHEVIYPFNYAFMDKFTLPLSHDEVVHCKGSLLNKMPGNEAQKFSGLRLLLSCMMCHPGKKLLFMGGEFGQKGEWACKGELEWHVLNHEQHQSLRNFIRDLNHFYLRSPALWERDFDSGTLEWIVECDREKGVVAYLRKGLQQQLLCIHNFSPAQHNDYSFHMERRPFALVHSTEANFSPHLRVADHWVTMSVPPLSTFVFEVERD